MENLIEIKFDAPLELPRANRGLTNFYDEFSSIELRFPQRIAATNTWIGDLGYTNIPNLSYIPCWQGDDVTVYRGGLKCQIVLGKLSGTITGSDYVSVFVSNFKKLLSGSKFKISLLVTNPALAHPANFPTVRVFILKIISNLPYVLADQTLTLPDCPLTSAGGAAFPGSSLALTPAVPKIQTK